MSIKKEGDVRKFEKYLGDWKIKNIVKNTGAQKNLTLKAQKCPHCGGMFGDERIFTFNYIEELKEGNRTMHLAVSDCGRYVILEEYLDDKEIKNMVR